MHLPVRAAAAEGAGGGDEFSLIYIHFRSIHGMTVEDSWNTQAPLRGQGDRFAARGGASRAGAGLYSNVNGMTGLHCWLACTTASIDSPSCSTPQPAVERRSSH